MKKLYIFLFALISHNVNAEWGEQWGSMVWGQSSANVPMMGGIGRFIFFFSLLAIGMLVIRRWSLIKALPIFVFFAFIPAMVDANEDQNPSDSDNDFNDFSISLPHQFQNGQVADAEEMNANLAAITSAIEQIMQSNADNLNAIQSSCTTAGGTWENNSCTQTSCGASGPNFSPGDFVTANVCPQYGGTVRQPDSYACNTYGTRCSADCAHTVASFDMMMGDIWVPISCNDASNCNLTDNSIFNYICDDSIDQASYDTGYIAGVNSVDITTDNQSSYDNGYNAGVASVDITSDNQNVCESGGGTWANGFCTSDDTSNNYNCFAGGFCSTNNYAASYQGNIYYGDTKPASCSNSEWNAGQYMNGIPQAMGILAAYICDQ